MKLLRDAVTVRSLRQFPLRLVLFGMAGLASFGFGFLRYSAVDAGRLVQRFGYFTMMATFLWWLYSLYCLFPKLSGSAVRGWLGQHRSAGLLIAGLTVVACFIFPYSYKILYDELVLQAAAWNLHFFREFGTLIRGYEVEGVFRSLEVYLDKRPFFYPFILSLVHDMAGYRESNAYLLNTLLLPSGLLLLYGVLHKLGGLMAGLAGLACFGASALLAQNANGSGMEMLNVNMLLLTVWLAINYLGEPDENRLSALVLSCVLLAQTRYESALFVVPAAVVILEGWRRTGRVILPAAALFAPVLLIPCALHNTYLSGTPALWELKEDMVSRFASNYFLENLAHAGAYFSDSSGKLLNSWWLSLAGFPALGAVIFMLVWRGRNWKMASPAVITAFLFSLGVTANLSLLMFYYWGQLDDPIVSRLVLPFNVVLTFSIAWWIGQFESLWQKRAATWLVAGALFSYLGFGLKAAAHDRGINQLASEIVWEERWVSTLPPRLRLMITNKSPFNWLIHSMPSISVQRARSKAEQVQFHLKGGTFQEVLVSQYYRPVGPEGGFQLDPRDELPAAYVLEPVIEQRMGARLLRISRVADIRIPEKSTKPEVETCQDKTAARSATASLTLPVESLSASDSTQYAKP